MGKSAPITQEVLINTLNEVLVDFRFSLNKDLAKFATKEDLERFATKEDLERFATKEDLERFATKKDLARSEANLTSEIGSTVDRIIEILDEMEVKSVRRNEFEELKQQVNRLAIAN